MSTASKRAESPNHGDRIARDELLAALEGFQPVLLSRQAPPARAPRFKEETEKFIPETSKINVGTTHPTGKKLAMLLKDKPPASKSSSATMNENATTTGMPANSNDINKASKESQGGKSSPGPKIQKIRPADIAFPSANNFLDHSPNAPFKLDMHALANPEGPSQQVFSDRRDVEDPEAFRQHLKMQSKLGSEKGVHAVCMMEFGCDRAVTGLVVCDPATRAWLRAHPLFNTLMHVEPHTSQFAFHIADVPGRGKGLVASRLIAKGECIVREPPLLVTPQGLSTGLVASFHQTLDQCMHYRTRIALDALDNCHGHVPGVSPRIGILRTNGVAIDFPTAKAQLGGVFELISRLNHSCEPNVMLRWSYKDMQGSVWAMKAIQPGDELVFDYTNNSRASKKTRRAELLKKYKFFCTCTKCGPK
ncbi:SET domain-containing protein [Auricularia subglabra TFB-10046 SS5]|nr:SET domain-containing protein [Auricularia subglabra TFB-10046 SS5]